MTTAVGLLLGVGLLLVLQACLTPLRLSIEAARRPPRVAAHSWPDAVDDVVACVVAGIALPQAVAHLAVAGPVPTRPHFAVAARVHAQTGDFAAGLAAARDSANDAIADTLCAAMTLAYRVGGRDLGTVLRGLSESLRDDIRVRGELEARQSWTVNGARIAIAAPWLTVLVLCTRPDAAAVYRSPAGLRVLVGCAVVTLLAYATMRAIGRLPGGARL